MLEPIIKLNIPHEFYFIKYDFEPIFDFSSLKEDEVFVYTNYFGICNHIVKKINFLCQNIIIDNSQAFFSKPFRNVDTFYSPRKFFGVPDGAYLYTDKKHQINAQRDISCFRFEHLLGRVDIGAEDFFESFRDNEKNLAGQPINEMSYLTKSILSGIQYNRISEIRRSNYKTLNDALRDINLLPIDLLLTSTPIVYPLMIKNSNLHKELINNKVYVAQYWPNVLNWVEPETIEYNFAQYILPLPIDQRYNSFDMEFIINIVLKNVYSTN